MELFTEIILERKRELEASVFGCYFAAASAAKSGGGGSSACMQLLACLSVHQTSVPFPSLSLVLVGQKLLVLDDQFKNVLQVIPNMNRTSGLFNSKSD